jgi:hypothetical protein
MFTDDDIVAALCTVAALFFGVKGVLALIAEGGRWLASLEVAGCVIGGAVLLVVAVIVGSQFGRGRARIQHVQGDDRADAARHEAGHAAVGRFIRARVGRGWINNRGGGAIAVYDEHKAPEERIAVTLGGGMAEGAAEDAPQCRGDRRLIGRVLDRVPRRDHASTLEKARDIARQGIAAESAYARRIEQKLLDHGKV